MNVLIAFIIGAFISRWHGGGWGIPGPRWLKGTLWALPFGLFCLTPTITFSTAIVAVLNFAASLAAKSTGHGRGQSLKEPLKGEPEKLEFLVLWAWPHLAVYWYKVLIMAVCGLATVSGGIIGALAFGHVLAAGVIAVGGLATALAYIIGWAIYPKQNGKGLPSLNQATQIGEFLSGGFAYAALAIALYFV